jgi:DnaK suppressor protein
MGRKEDLQKLRGLLQRRRRTLLESAVAAQRELAALKDQERDPEYEEGAQSELADYTLSHLIENTRRELGQIDNAMQRMDQKVFGRCIDCDAEIPLERLEALPYAVRCEEDATRHEVEARGSHYVAPSL